MRAISLEGVPDVTPVRVDHLGPNDVLLIRVPVDMDSGALPRLRDAVEKTWPGKRFLILSNDIEISIIRGLET